MKRLEPEELLEKLVSFRSTSYGEEELVDWLRGYLEQNGLEPEVDSYDPGDYIQGYSKGETSNIYLDIGDGDQVLLLYAHMDVVDAPDRLFRPRVEEGRIYGRGTADMKTALAALAYVAANDELPGRCLFHFIADEETSGTGARRAVERLEEKEFDKLDALLMEPTDDFSFLEREAKGYAFCRVKGSFEQLWEIAGAAASFRGDGEHQELGRNQVTPTKFVPREEPGEEYSAVTGEAAHASRPENGENSLVKLLESREEVQLAWNPGNSRNTIPGETRYIAGEPAEVPATLYIDVRTLPGNHRDVLDWLEEVTGELELVIDDSGPAYTTSTGSRLVDACLEAVPEAEAESSRGASDAGYYSKAADTVIGGFGPGKQEVIHTDSEYIDREQIGRAAEVVRGIIENYHS